MLSLQKNPVGRDTKNALLRVTIVNDDEGVLFLVELVNDAVVEVAHHTTFFLQPERGAKATAEGVVVTGNANVREPPNALCALTALNGDGLVSDVEVNAHRGLLKSGKK